MEKAHLITLASIFAAHVGRSDVTVAKWCGLHTRLFSRLRKGEGCRVDTYNAALEAFSARWPDDLEWPRHIPRHPKAKKEAA